ncbi:MAG: peptidylprolyl isomerase [Spirochaetia bacterium]|nr:peptidylprolyl isomerase [Spirochaetia bacterium]
MKSVRVLLVFIIINLNIESQPLNEIVAVISSKPVTRLDLVKEINYLKKQKGGLIKGRNIESQALDKLIEREIINVIADAESIRISPDRIDEIIENDMTRSGISDEKTFEKMLKKEIGISLSEYRIEKARQMKTQQVVQLRVTVPNPSSSQIADWYKKNKQKIGNKMLLRIIIKSFKKGDMQDELRVSKELNKARGEAVKNFEETAAKVSEHASKKNGGLLGWVTLSELAALDEALANIVYQTKQGQVSTVSVGKLGYFIVKVEKTKPIELEDVYEQIRAKLYFENQQAAFSDWIKEERKNIAVKIYMQDYQEL